MSQAKQQAANLALFRAAESVGIEPANAPVKGPQLRTARITDGMFRDHYLQLSNVFGCDIEWGSDVYAQIYRTSDGHTVNQFCLQFADDLMDWESGEPTMSGYYYDDKQTSVVEPFRSSCSRFEVDPEQEYGIPRVLADFLMAANKVAVPQRMVAVCAGCKSSNVRRRTTSDQVWDIDTQRWVEDYNDCGVQEYCGDCSIDQDIIMVPESEADPVV